MKLKLDRTDKIVAGVAVAWIVIIGWLPSLALGVGTFAFRDKLKAVVLKYKVLSYIAKVKSYFTNK